MDRYKTFIGPATQLAPFVGGVPKAERAYAALEEKASQAEIGGDLEQAGSIRAELIEIDRHAAWELWVLSTQIDLTASSSTREATAPACGWSLTQRQLAGIRLHFANTFQFKHARYFENCLQRIEVRIRIAFNRHVKKGLLFPLCGNNPPRSVQRYRLLEYMASRTEAAGGATPPGKIRQELDAINDCVARELRSLKRVYGPLETLAAAVGVPVRQASVQVQPPAPAKSLPETGVTEPQRLPPTTEGVPHPAPLPPPRTPERPGTGAVAVPPVADPFHEPPGPSSRFMPARAAGTASAPAREQLPAHRQAIVDRFKSGEVLAEARSNLGYGAEALGLSPELVRGLHEDLEALHRFDGQDPAALADIDWTGIEALVAILDFVPPSP